MPSKDTCGIASGVLLRLGQSSATISVVMNKAHKETILPATHALLKRAEARVEKAEARTEQAEIRTEQAETRTEHAMTRTESAETRAEQAETRTEFAKTRAEEAEIRTGKAVTRAEYAESSLEILTQRGMADLPTKDLPMDMADVSSAFELLTRRQREILKFIAQGENTKHIADLLKLSPKTVEYHRLKIMNRLDIHDVPGLVRFALRIGLASLDG